MMFSLEQLRETMKQQQIDGLYLSQLDNVRYVSGYTSDDATLFISLTGQYFLTDPRYTEQAAAECPDWTLVNWREIGTMADAVAACAQKEGCKAVGFEGSVLAFDAYQTLRQSLSCELVSVNGLIEEFRSYKTPYEIECLRAACDIACRAFEQIIGDIRVGMTEKELASRLSHYMVMEGADTQPYGNILISGARTSLLHGIPSSKSIEYGDFVLMDFGCAYKGYLSDMTRTVVVGQASPKQKEVYNLCRRMTEIGIEKMQVGTTAKEVYDATCTIIEGTEYYPYHYAGIGHGIGVFVHEIPFLGPKYPNPLHKNTVMTIEPGLYIPNWGGCRIEDQILITETGNENLISATHELIEL